MYIFGYLADSFYTWITADKKVDLISIIKNYFDEQNIQVKEDL